MRTKEITTQLITSSTFPEAAQNDQTWSKDEKLNQILTEFGSRLEVTRDNFTISDLVKAICGQPNTFLRDQFGKLTSLAGAQKLKSPHQIPQYFFNRQQALCARAAFELHYQGYNENEIGLMLKELLIHQELNAKVHAPTKAKMTSSSEILLARARSRRKTLKMKRIEIGLLPIGQLDAEYARFIAFYARKRDQEFVVEDKSEEDKREEIPEELKGPPVSSTVLENLPEPNLEQVGQAKERVAKWDQLDSLSIQKINGLAELGIDQRQILSIIYASEFAKGRTVVNLGGYTHSALTRAFEWWCRLKEFKSDVKLAELIAEIEHKSKVEEVGF